MKSWTEDMSDQQERVPFMIRGMEIVPSSPVFCPITGNELR